MAHNMVIVISPILVCISKRYLVVAAGNCTLTDLLQPLVPGSCRNGQGEGTAVTSLFFSLIFYKKLLHRGKVVRENLGLDLNLLR